MFTPPEFQLELAHLRQREMIRQARVCRYTVDLLVAVAARWVGKHRTTAPVAPDRRVQVA